MTARKALAERHDPCNDSSCATCWARCPRRSVQLVVLRAPCRLSLARRRVVKSFDFVEHGLGASGIIAGQAEATGHPTGCDLGLDLGGPVRKVVIASLV